MAAKRILVTGKNGMLATDLVAALTTAGFDVAGFDLPEVDITDRDAVQRAVAAARPDLVIHTAAMTAVDACEDAVETAMTVNRDGAGNVAAAAAGFGAPIIHISTDYVFNGRGTRPYLEDDPIDPLGVYGCGKAEGEAAVAEANPAHIICRTSWLYGINGKNFVSTILRMAGERDELTIVNDQVGCPTFTGHLSSALADLSRALLDTPENIRPSLHGIYHTVNSGHCSWHEFAQTILQAAGITHVKVKPVSTTELVQMFPNIKAPRPAYSVLDTSKIRRIFGITFPHWREGLDEFLLQYKRQ